LTRAAGRAVQDAGKDLAKFDNDARYTIMFGPDRCGATDKTHFILQHQNPVSKEWEEKHATGMPPAHADRNTHLYTLVLRADNTFEVLVDLESRKKGSLLEDMSPPVNPSKEIDDPADSKPADWVEESHIDDPEASKPADWDEDAPRMVDDMSAVLYPAPPLAGASARGSALQRTRDGSRASGRGGGAGKTSGVGG